MLNPTNPHNFGPHTPTTLEELRTAKLYQRGIITWAEYWDAIVAHWITTALQS